LYIEILYDEWAGVWDPQLYGHLLDSLPATERLRISRYKDPKEQQQRLTARLMLQQWYCRHMNAARLPELQYADTNKPGVEGITFSTAHAGAMVVCAVTHGTIAMGIDIEPLKEQEGRLLKDFFTAREWTMIQQAPAANEQLLTLWTRKEALLKASGQGMLADLPAIDVSDDEVYYKGRRYFFHHPDIASAYTAALATDVPGCSCRLLRWEPQS